ncbi:MAG: hypothetical protein ACI4N1_02325 [Stenotrophomonas koreensis]
MAGLLPLSRCRTGSLAAQVGKHRFQRAHIPCQRGLAAFLFRVLRIEACYGLSLALTLPGKLAGEQAVLFPLFKQTGLQLPGLQLKRLDLGQVGIDLVQQFNTLLLQIALIGQNPLAVCQLILRQQQLQCRMVALALAITQQAGQLASLGLNGSLQAGALLPCLRQLLLLLAQCLLNFGQLTAGTRHVGIGLPQLGIGCLQRLLRIAPFGRRLSQLLARLL